ncbi:MAG: thiamine-phosphate pyrophosphorylase [Candidatus Omnitrophota bacterium]
MLKQRSVNRIIDANINRAKEGLRVCEEVCRFALESKKSTILFKRIRHKLTRLIKEVGLRVNFIRNRDSLKDAGKGIKADELKRSGIEDIFMANIQRAKESVRVLEEFSKLSDVKVSMKFKRLRYSIYEVEKQVLTKLIK